MTNSKWPTCGHFRSTNFLVNAIHSTFFLCFTPNLYHISISLIGRMSSKLGKIRIETIGHGGQNGRISVFMWEIILLYLCERSTHGIYAGDQLVILMWEINSWYLCRRSTRGIYVGDQLVVFMWEINSWYLCRSSTRGIYVGDQLMVFMWEINSWYLCRRSTRGIYVGDQLVVFM